MKKWVIILLAVFGVLMLLSLYPLLYLIALNKVIIEDVVISRLIFEKEGLVLEGTLLFHNPGIVSVIIDRIEYAFLLNNTGEELGTGTIAGTTIPAGGTAELPFKKIVDWQPSLDTALELLKAKKVILTTKGTVQAKFLGMRFSSPFVMHLDVKAHLLQYVQQQAKQFGHGLQQGLGQLMELLVP